MSPTTLSQFRVTLKATEAAQPIMITEAFLQLHHSSPSPLPNNAILTSQRYRSQEDSSKTFLHANLYLIICDPRNPSCNTYGVSFVFHHDWDCICFYHYPYFTEETQALRIFVNWHPPLFYVHSQTDKERLTLVLESAK